MASLKTLLLLVLLTFAVNISHAHKHNANQASDVKTVKITDTLYMLQVGGGNIGVSVGKDGLWIIDSDHAHASEKLATALKDLSKAPAKILVNTHWHYDHTGGNQAIGDSGTVIIAHDNVRQRLSSKQYIKAFDRHIDPSPAIALPIITYTDQTQVHLNGEPAHLIPVNPAHTDGDTFIHWPQSNVIHTGDLFFNGFYPFIDASSGGDIDGVIQAMDHIIKLSNTQTKIIPGHGPLASLDDLKAAQEMLKTISTRIENARAAGKSLDEWKAGTPLSDLDKKWGKGFLNSDRFATIAWDTKH